MDVQINERTVPPKAMSLLIKNAWLATLASSLITVALDVYFWMSGVRTWLVYMNLIYVVVFCGLAYGIYRRSRSCAIAMLLVFILDKAYSPIVYSTSTIIVFVLFTLCFSGGVVGTFWYHSKAKSADLSGKTLTVFTVLCATVAIGLVAGMKYITTDSPQQAWSDFQTLLEKEYAKGSFPVRLDYYTVLQNAELNGHTLTYIYSVENTRLVDISDSQLETQARAHFTGAYCGSNMVQKYGLQVDYVYTQGLTEKNYSYRKSDCVY